VSLHCCRIQSLSAGSSRTFDTNLIDTIHHRCALLRAVSMAAYAILGSILRVSRCRLLLAACELHDTCVLVTAMSPQSYTCRTNVIPWCEDHSLGTSPHTSVVSISTSPSLCASCADLHTTDSGRMSKLSSGSQEPRSHLRGLSIYPSATVCSQCM
jgi:hypothetical protein